MTISFARHRFPPVVIRHAVWLYVRFTLSYRDVEDLLKRLVEIGNEIVRIFDADPEADESRGDAKRICSSGGMSECVIEPRSA
jgi:hypothetical protein